MNEDVFNMSVRKFLKKVGVTSQREIESAIRDACANVKTYLDSLNSKKEISRSGSWSAGYLS